MDWVPQTIRALTEMLREGGVGGVLTFLFALAAFGVAIIVALAIWKHLGAILDLGKQFVTARSITDDKIVTNLREIKEASIKTGESNQKIVEMVNSLNVKTDAGNGVLKEMSTVLSTSLIDKATADLKSATEEMTSLLNDLKSDYQIVWKGITLRGFVEAEKSKHLIRGEASGGDKCWTLSPDARTIYQEIAAQLREVRVNLENILGREPTDDTLSWAIEKRFQKWMVDHACPSLGVNQHGCLAIACVIAREN